MDLDPIEDLKDATKDASKDHAKQRSTAKTYSKQARKSKSSSSKDCSSAMSSTSGIKKMSREPTDYSRAALERELAGLREEEREYRKRLGRIEDEKEETREEKADGRRRVSRRITIRDLRMRNAVDDIASKMGALDMGRKREEQR